uniref:Methyl-accepting transducer domain-containing protein n=1 Tax=Phenylobacterium glaciei TaxID=2803784 RepID=A0A974SAV5_9CAUL|nr:hypothetical protein JKL49_06875 [Phenylobacterium glaciei]
MDQVTQQNAAMVEESTAASHNLAQEAQGLAGSVGMFQIGDQHAPPPAIARNATTTPARRPRPRPSLPVMARPRSAPPPATAPPSANPRRYRAPMNGKNSDGHGHRNRRGPGDGQPRSGSGPAGG